MILLTGASGFIGNYLLNALIKEFGKDRVIALTSKPINNCQFLLHSDYSFDPDFFIEAGYSDINTIIHAGAFTPKSSGESNLIERCNSNIVNTITLLSTNLPHIKKFIFLSTLDVYGQDKIINEESIVNPNSLYGHSKIYCEKLITTWATQNKIKNQILRIGHVYGPGEEKYQKLIPVVMKQIISDERVKLFGSGDDIRTFIYISDAVQSIIKAVGLETNNEIINVVGDEQISIIKLINEIIKLSGKNTLIERIELDAKPRDLIFNNTKLKKMLHLPTVPLSIGLKKEWEYLKQL